MVLGIEAALFAAPLASLAVAEDEAQEQDLDSEALERLAAAYQQIVEDRGSCTDDPRDDLKAAAEAVYMSWMSERACAYRKIEHLEDLQGTAVTVQAMVFGNYNTRSGAGVAFSRKSVDRRCGAGYRRFIRVAGRRCRLRPSQPADGGTRSRGFCPRWTPSCARRSNGLSKSSATFRMSSLPLKMENCGFCKRARRSVRRARPCVSPIDFVQGRTHHARRGFAAS